MEQFIYKHYQKVLKLSVIFLLVSFFSFESIFKFTILKYSSASSNYTSETGEVLISDDIKIISTGDQIEPIEVVEELDNEENNFPVLSDTKVNIEVNSIYEFELDEFTSNFSDEDGDTLKKIMITSLPDEGTLYFIDEDEDGEEIIVEVEEDDEFLVNEIKEIYFEPQVDYVGGTYFTWDAYDGDDWAGNDAYFDIFIEQPKEDSFKKTGEDLGGFIPMVQPPVGTDGSVTEDEDTTYTFKVSDFPWTHGGAGETNDLFDGIRLITDVGQGTLQYGGGAVSTLTDYNDVTQFTFDPVADENGTPYTSFTYKLIDDSGDVSTINYTMNINITPVDDDPTVANSISDVTADEDDPNDVIDLTNVFTDIDNDDSTITKTVNLNTNPTLVTATIVGNNLTLDYQAEQSGTADITIRGSSNGKIVDDGPFTVTVDPVDDDPTVAIPISDVIANEDDPDDVIDLTNVFTDIDNDDLAITKSVLSNSNPGLVTASIVGNALTLDYQPGQTGTAIVEIRGTSNTKSIDDSFTITVNEVDDPPTVANAISDVSADEDDTDDTIDLTNVFTDVDDIDAAITKSVVSNSNPSLVGASIAGNTLTLDYQLDQNGTATIVVRGNSDGQTVDDTFTVTVDPVNDGPVITSSATLTATEDALYTYDVVATDVDDVIPTGVTYSLAGEPAGMTIDSNGRITWTPPNAVSTSGLVTISVEDGGEDGAVAATESFTITVTAVNDSPVLDTTESPDLSAIDEDVFTSGGESVEEVIVDGSITDIDGAAVEAMAVTSVDNTNGRWQYSLNNGSSWSNFSGSTGIINLTASARLLDGTLSGASTNLIRFVPNANWNGATEIQFKAWDKSAGTVGGTLNTSVHTDTSAFSASADYLDHSVNPINDAPVLNNGYSPVLDNIDEDDTSSAGTSIANIINIASITEPTFDESPVEAIAVTGVDNTNGRWQYSTNNGGAWINFTGTTGSPVDFEANARLLDGTLSGGSTHKIRFVPDTDFNGSATITFRAWDKSSGVAGITIDATDNGGIYPISSVEDTMSITVDPINDAPVLTLGNCLTQLDSPLDEINEGEMFYLSDPSAVNPNPGFSDCTIDVYDLDAGEGTGIIDLTLTADNGIFQVTNSGGLTAVDNNGTGTVTLRGTQAAIDAIFINGYIYFILDNIDIDTMVNIDVDLFDNNNFGALGDNDANTESFTFKVKNLAFFNTNSGIGYSYLDTAIAAANDGDVIEVDSNTFDMDLADPMKGVLSSTESTVVVDKGVTIMSRSGVADEVNGPIFQNLNNGQDLFDIQDSDVVFDGIVFTNINSASSLFNLDTGDDRFTVSDSVFIDLNGAVVTADDVDGLNLVRNEIRGTNIPQPIILSNLEDFTLTDNTITDSAGVGIDISDSTDFTLDGNTIDSSASFGLNMDNCEYFDILSNTFTNHTAYDMNIINSDISNSTVYYNRFMEANGLGLDFTPIDDTDLDARYNYWGDALGPRVEGRAFEFSSGSLVSTDVEYQPWYASSTTTPANQNQYIVANSDEDDEIVAYSDDVDESLKILDYKPQVMYIYGDNVWYESYPDQTNLDNDDLDLADNLGIMVEKEGDGNPFWTLIKFKSNPNAAKANGVPSQNVLDDSYYDIHLNITDTTDRMYIKTFFTRNMVDNIEESTLRLYYWNGADWVQFKNSGVTLVRSGGHEIEKYIGYVWAVATTQAEIDAFGGVQIFAGGDSRSTTPYQSGGKGGHGGPGGGGGGGSTYIGRPYTFPDIDGNIFEDHIQNLYNDQIVGGYSDGTYRPYDNVTRAQMAKFIVKAFNLSMNTSGDRFSDASDFAGNDLYEYVQTLKNYGIVSGYEDGTFRPNDFVTRGQATKFVVKAIEVRGIDVILDNPQNFGDVADDHTFSRYINFLAYKNIETEPVISGYSDGTFKPDVNVSRGAMAKIVDLSRKIY